jgi:hypothetical protein
MHVQYCKNILEVQSIHVFQMCGMLDIVGYEYLLKPLIMSSMY